MTKRLLVTILAASMALTSVSTAPARAADSGELGRFLLGAGALVIIGSALSNQNKRRHTQYTTVTPTHPRKVVPSFCMRQSRFDDGPRRFFGKRCLRNNMRKDFHALPGHCQRTIRTHNGNRRVFGARCLRKNGWVFG
ncbi:hypothetical protein AIOL_004147 [Candidatus Rhodobacter oscarellae]|uniref:Secreted protein n=1 Tax=Candidatus Rhodobacter oscarellae TaxID=1675527 RepID=A0A0J9E964_9RHOB|nr:hypothetical protein [Candidatus Rhodobacter lobularis]KMW59166.1 hypothetical protein AIOL_004147 [Candidatus Rhodobacter lobularis]